MKKVIPKKLKPGDEIRIVAPAISLAYFPEDVQKISLERLKKWGLRVTFGKYVFKKDVLKSSGNSYRVADVNEAFRDKNVRAVLAAAGGHTSNQILDLLDYRMILKNPKIFCGFSDITAPSNAIYAKTGLITYSGPNFIDLGMIKNFEYSEKYFLSCLFNDQSFTIEPSEKWSDDRWRLNQEERNFLENSGYQSLNYGQAKGTIIGGNLCTLNLLHGTEYMPDLPGSILFLEDDDLPKSLTPQEFVRNLQSLAHLPGFKKIKGLIIGRFQRASEMNLAKLRYIIGSIPGFKNIPVIVNVDFGHTTPIFTFPIGGTAKIVSSPKKSLIEIIKH